MGRLAGLLSHPFFVFTTIRISPAAKRRTGLAPYAARLQSNGWFLRCAGPKGFQVWGQDADRMHHERVIVLNAPWIGLSGPRLSPFSRFNCRG
jgi:hypothetical protein